MIMQNEEEIKIAISKKKIIWLIIGAIGFVIVSIGATYFFDHVPPREGTFMSFLIEYYWKPFGWWFTPAFFGLCGILGIHIYFTKSIGMTITRKGIIDNSSAVPAGFISWKDIERISDYSIAGQKIVGIFMRDSDNFIRTGTFWQRFVWKANRKLSGAPVNISANTLKMTHDELLQLLNDCQRKYSGYAV